MAKKNVASDPMLPANYRKEMESQGWTEQGGEVEKWDDKVGEEITGRYLKLIPARDEDSSPVLVITDSGSGATRRFWCPTILESKLEGIGIGSIVKIICLGQTVPIKNRKQMAWGFTVFSREA